MKKLHVFNLIVAIYAMIGGILFFIMQTSKLFRIEAAEIEMAESPLGLFDWGYVWADTLLIVPFLFVGGILLLMRNRLVHRLGRLLIFAGFLLHLYAIIFFFIGLRAIGQPVSATEFWLNIIFTILGVISMIYCMWKTITE